MTKTASTMLELGSKAVDFTLRDVVLGEPVSLKDYRGPDATLVMFICNHCQFVQHVKRELASIGDDYRDQGLGVIAICSNDAENHPDDTPEKLKELALDEGFKFPVCHDPTQKVAKAYRAACTPDFFLFDHNLKLVYRGQLDDSRPGSDIPVDGRDLRAAIEATIQGRPVSGNQKPSVGCNIKWKPGNEPDYD